MIYILAAFTSGGIVVLTILYNSHLSKHIGGTNGVTINYLTGVITSIVIVLIMNKFRIMNLQSTPLYLFVAGGFLGVFVISVNNVLLPKVPVLLFTVLLFFGQLLASFAFDFYNRVELTITQIIGIIVVFIGIILNAYLNPEGNSRTIFKSK
jgi:transporter family-2 protein